MIKSNGLPYRPKKMVIEEKRERKRIARIESKEQFELALNQFLSTKKHENSKAGSKLNLGDGLSLHVSKNKIMNFYFIYCIHGSGNTLSIGKYPKVSFDEARLDADEFKKELSKEKKNSTKIKFRQKIKEEKQKNFESDLSHEKDFKNLNTIFLTVISNLYKKPSNQELEINIAIYLMMNFPEYGIKIIRSKCDFMESLPFLRIILEKYENSFYVSPHKYNPITTNRKNGIDIQDCIKNILDHINEINDANNYSNKHILPYLQNKSDKKVYDELNHYISNICPHVKVDLKNLPDIFYKYSIHFSGFNEQFLNAVASENQVGERIFGHNGNFYYHQIKALRSWWHERLIENQKISL
jgi:hypothetical protein